MDLIEADDIKKRWQEYTELYKKELHDPDNHDGVITQICESASHLIFKKNIFSILIIKFCE